MSDQQDDIKRHCLEWEFFKLHAIQRLTCFRFYISLVIILLGAYFAIYGHLLDGSQKTIFLYMCLIIVGIILGAVSSVFYALDQRNCELIKNVKHSSNEIDKLSCASSELVLFRQIFKYVFRGVFCISIILSLLGAYKLGLDKIQCACSIRSDINNNYINTGKYNPRNGKDTTVTDTGRMPIPEAHVDPPHH